MTPEKKEKAPEPLAPNRTPGQCTCGKARREILRDGSLMETHLPYCQIREKVRVYR